MSEPLDRPIRPVATPSRVAWWSTSSSQRLIKFIASLLLELLPVEATLVVAAGYNSRNGLAIPVPPWFLAGALLLAFGIGHFHIGASPQRLLAISLPFMVITALLLVRVSPATYGSYGSGFFDWSWIFAVGQDFADQASRSSAIIPLLLPLAYIWWRGLRLGGDSPDHQTVMNRFKYGMIAMIAITIASIAVPAAVQPRVIDILSLLLPAEVFVGLMASALGRLAQNQVEHRGDAYLANNNQLWLGTAFALAVVTVGFALLINLILNYQSAGALLALLGPVGPVVSRLATVLVNALAQLLHFLFGWLVGAIELIQRQQTLRIPQSSAPSSSETHRHSSPSIPQIFITIAALLLQVLSIVVTIAVLVWVFRTVVTHRRPLEDILDEERESLDGDSIFKEQFRAFLARLRPQRKPAWIDPLTPGSVRYLYRDVLETASRRGLARNSDETPDEYGARLAHSGALAGLETRGEAPEALEGLSEAYDASRYAQREPESQDLSRIRQLAKLVTERLRRSGN